MCIFVVSPRLILVAQIFLCVCVCVNIVETIMASQFNIQQLGPLISDLRQLDAALARINSVFPQVQLLNSQTAQLEQQANILGSLPQLRSQAAALRSAAASNRAAANQLLASISADQALVQRVQSANGLAVFQAQQIIAQNPGPRFT